MGALKIAFDAIIVGALALPWVVFATDLSFLKDSNDDNHVKVAWDFVKEPKECTDRSSCSDVVRGDLFPWFGDISDGTGLFQ